jgi:radical SAM superfamily enzyme YgiQ (UPF0313 family)
MRIGIVSVHVDYHRRGRHHRGVLQPQVGPLIAGLLPRDVDIEVINDAWEEPDWTRDYDLLFISSLHPDFDRARQISHYWRRRGAKTVFGGTMASTYAGLCRPFFDSIVIGDPEGSVSAIYRDFCRRQLKPIYVSGPYDPVRVPVPRFDLLAHKQLLPLSLEATRGCPFACDFCALTAIGTRHCTRPPELVVRDIREGQRMLRGVVPWLKRRLVVFCDNNFGGNASYLRELCDALTPLGIRWGTAATFNVVANLEQVRMLSRAGCRFVFMGLESFNPRVILDMNKPQNAVHLTKQVIEQCLDHGILIVAGLMLSPLLDDVPYIRSLPEHLERCGLIVPSFLSFECPIPGTPNFRRHADSKPSTFLPDALLRDFNGYALVTRPSRESPEAFVEEYQRTLGIVSSGHQKLKKLAHDWARLGARGWFLSGLVDTIDQITPFPRPAPDRSYVTGTDTIPPEAASVPLSAVDFDSELEHRAVMEPWRVSDHDGRVLPMWRDPTTVFERGGRISSQVLELLSGAD